VELCIHHDDLKNNRHMNSRVDLASKDDVYYQDGVVILFWAVGKCACRVSFFK
jgi:hypothetical protein